MSLTLTMGFIACLLAVSSECASDTAASPSQDLDFQVGERVFDQIKWATANPEAHIPPHWYRKLVLVFMDTELARRRAEAAADTATSPSTKLQKSQDRVKELDTRNESICEKNHGLKLENRKLKIALNESRVLYHEAEEARQELERNNQTLTKESKQHSKTLEQILDHHKRAVAYKAKKYNEERAKLQAQIEARKVENTRLETENARLNQKLAAKPEACLEETGDAKSEAKECTVCQENPSTHAFIPCGHRCVCEDCKEEVRNSKKCPMCRAKIQDTLQIFDA